MYRRISKHVTTKKINETQRKAAKEEMKDKINTRLTRTIQKIVIVSPYLSVIFFFNISRLNSQIKRQGSAMCYPHVTLDISTHIGLTCKNG